MKEQIIELRKQGLTFKQIVEQLNCAKSTVSYHLNSVGLGGGIKKTSLKDKIEKFRLQGKTYDEIRILVDISEDKLKRVCRDLGLNVPTSHLGGSKNDLDKNLVLSVYAEKKSLRKTAEYFKISRETLRKHYIKNEDLTIVPKQTKKERNESVKQHVISWRQDKKVKLVNYKGGKCERCGYDKCVQALQFHHLNPDEKDFAISGKSYSFERLKKEVDKCIMVCANCHIEIHEELKK